MLTRNHHRRGMTLVELLVVIGIVTLLMVVAVPLVRNGFEDRKVREASRELNAFINRARAQALQTGRPVGIWIQPSENNVQASRQLYIMEVPAPYAGDTRGATCRLIDVQHFGPDGRPGVAGTDDDGNQVTDDLREAGWPGSDDVTDGNPSIAIFGSSAASLPYIAAPGDFIRFNHQGPLYRILTIDQYRSGNVSYYYAGVTHPEAMYDPGSDGRWGVAGVDDDGDGVTDNRSESGWTLSDDIWLSPPGPQQAHREVPFQIYRQPVPAQMQLPQQGINSSVDRQAFRSTARTLQLPNGAALDLQISGVGAALTPSTGTEFGLLPREAVVIVFAPDGSVDWIYLGRRPFRPMGTVYLMVGRNELVGQWNPGADGAWGVAGVNDDGAGGVDDEGEAGWAGSDDVLANLANPSNLWVTIGHRSGAVSTASNAWSPTTPTLANARRFAREGQLIGGR